MNKKQWLTMYSSLTHSTCNIAYTFFFYPVDVFVIQELEYMITCGDRYENNNASWDSLILYILIYKQWQIGRVKLYIIRHWNLQCTLYHFSVTYTTRHFVKELKCHVDLLNTRQAKLWHIKYIDKGTFFPRRTI